MKLPIICVDGLDLVFFESKIQAESNLEPEDISDPGVELFDSEGNLLFALIDSEKGPGIGPFRLKRRQVRIVGLAGGENQRERLRIALQEFLEITRHVSKETLAGEDLELLIRRVTKYPLT